MVLVTYATTHGSTEEVAEAVATVLRGQNIDVSVMNMRKVRSLDSCDALVLGAPLYMFRLHKDARRFLSKHAGAIKLKPAAMFVLGPFHEVEKEWTDAHAQLEKELAKYPWFKPVAVELFGGKFDPNNMRMPYKLLPALKQLGEGDIRDWDKIREWAKGLPV